MMRRNIKIGVVLISFIVLLQLVSSVNSSVNISENEIFKNIDIEEFILPELPVEQCVPEWVELKTDCQKNGKIKGFYVDINDCYSLTENNGDKKAPKSEKYDCEFNINKTKSKKKIESPNYLISRDNSEWKIIKQDSFSKYIDYDFVYINDNYYRVDWKWKDNYIRDLLQLCGLLDKNNIHKCMNKKAIDYNRFNPIKIDYEGNLTEKNLLEIEQIFNCRKNITCIKSFPENENYSVEIIEYSKENFTKDYFNGKSFSEIKEDIKNIKLNGMPNSILKGDADIIGRFNPEKRNKGNFYIKLKDGFGISNGLQIKFGFNSLIVEFNNSKTNENLTFIGNENITRYLELDKDSNVTSAIFNLAGFSLGLGSSKGSDFDFDDFSHSGLYGSNFKDWLNISELQTFHLYDYSNFNEESIYNITVYGDTLNINYSLFHLDCPDGTGIEFNFNTLTSTVSIFNYTSSSYDIIDTFTHTASCSGSEVRFCAERNFNKNVSGINYKRNGEVFLKYSLTGDDSQPNSKTTYVTGGAVCNGVTIPTGNSFYLINFNHTSNSSITNPFVLSIDIQIWNYSGEFNSTYGIQTTNNFASQINTYLANCTPDANNKCQIPLIFHSDAAGKLEYSNINITYDFLYPNNPSMDAGNDGAVNWNYTGNFNSNETTSDFSSDLQSYLDNDTFCPPEQGACEIPLILNSTDGTLILSDLDISYFIYDTSPPVIYNVSVTPNPADEGDNLTILVNVTDNVGLSSIEVNFSNSLVNMSYNSTSELYGGYFLAPAPGNNPLIITAIDLNNLTTIFTISSISQQEVGQPCSGICSQSSGDDHELIIYNGGVKFSDSQIQNTTLEINATISNYATSSENDFIVELLVDGISYANNTISIANLSNNLTHFNWTTTSYGNHTITIKADASDIISEVNESNNEITKTIFVLDSDAPVINQIVVDSVAKGNPLNIQVNASDNANISTITAEINGTIINLEYNNSSGLYENSTIISNEGTHNLFIDIIDIYGLVTSQQIPVTIYPVESDLKVSTEDISFSILPLTEGNLINISALVHNEGGTDANQFNIEFLLDGISIQNNTLGVALQSFNATFFNWATIYGNHTLTFRVDTLEEISESNETNNELNFSIFVEDGDEPMVEEITISESIYVGSLISISVNASDNVNISQVNASIDDTTTILTYNSTIELYGGTITAPATSGVYNLNITAEDVNDLIGARKKQVTINPIEADLVVGEKDVIMNLDDPDLLNLNITIHNEGGTDANNFIVRFVINNDTIDEKIVSVEKASINLTSFNWTKEYSNNTIKIILDPTTVISESNETNNEYIREIFLSDTIAPLAPNLSASPDNWTTQTTHTVSWDAVNDTNGIDHYEYQIDFGDWTNIGLNISFITSVQTEGIHTVYVRAIDNPGNIGNMGNVSLFIDNTAPNTPTLREWHSGANWTQHSSPYYSWNDPDDIGSGVISYLGELNGQRIELNGSEIYHTNVSYGNHSFKVLAQDALGQNSSWSNTITIYVDTINPLETDINSSTHLDNNTWYNISIPIINFSAIDEHSGIYGFYYVADKNPSTIPDIMNQWTTNNIINITGVGGVFSGDNETENQTGLTDGEWYIHARAKDDVGNLGLNTTHYKVKIDVNAPIILNVTPENGSNINHSISSIAIEYNDGAAGVNTSAIVFKINGEDKTSNASINENFLSYSQGLTNGDYNITIYLEDNISNSRNFSWSFNINVTILPNDTSKFYIKNLSQDNVAWLGNEGNIILKGTCTSGGTCTAPTDSFIIGNSTDSTTAYIDMNGNLCVEQGDCSDQSASCNPTIGAFKIRNTTGSIVSYIDFNGDLCLTGGLYENADL